MLGTVILIMTNAELIQDAYSKYGIWDKVKKYTNNNGWCRVDHNEYPNIKKEFGSLKIHWWRPIELKGRIYNCA